MLELTLVWDADDGVLDVRDAHGRSFVLWASGDEILCRIDLGPQPMKFTGAQGARAFPRHIAECFDIAIAYVAAMENADVPT